METEHFEIKEMLWGHQKQQVWPQGAGLAGVCGQNVPWEGLPGRAGLLGPQSVPSHRALCPEGSQWMVYCAAIALLNTLIIFEQEIPHLHLSPGLQLTQPVLSRGQGPRTCLPPIPSLSLTTHFLLTEQCSGADETLTCCQGNVSLASCLLGYLEQPGKVTGKRENWF